MLDALGGLPEEGMHGALLAAFTLKQAIKDHLAYRKQPGRGLTGDTEVVNRDVQLFTKRNLSPGKRLGVRDKVLGRSGNC